jgi:glycosyltransferase involved in cell wall biosynthesis
VLHPRFDYVPKVPALTAPLYAIDVARAVASVAHGADVVLAAFAYPDGAAGVAIARALRVPCVVKVHGSDLNVAPRAQGPRAWLRWALPRAARIVAVSEPLAAAARALGADASRIDVVLDGVDARVFRPRDAVSARVALGLDPTRRYVVYIGRLERAKGTRELGEAFERLARHRADVDLLVVGDGSDRAPFERLAESRPGRVHRLGAVPMDEVASWIAAADVVTLPSWAEGTPNAILEALACARPVVATAVGGVPALVHDPSLGILVPPRDAVALARALDEALGRAWSVERFVELGGRRSWEVSAHELARSLARAVDGNARK